MLASIKQARWLETLREALISISALRNWGLFIASLLAVYWLQPSTPIRNLDFWLPTASLALTAVVWSATRPNARDGLRATLIEASAMALVVMVIASLRYVDALCCVVTRTRPPDLSSVVIGIAIAGGLCALAVRFVASRPARTTWLVIFIIALLVVLQTGPLAQTSAAVLRITQGQSADQATALDVRWLGFSFIAFRLIHALRDRASGKLPAMSLREFVTYVVFFPSLIAGPIDRVERFIKDLRAPFVFNLADTTEGARRIIIGVFKKLVIADVLAMIALNAVNAEQTRPGPWAWVLLYAYAFYILFDFSGYTDIAIGVGRLFGVKLPENFNQPYLKQNLTSFWNSWHMTLAQWFRAYYFNPLTRNLRIRGISPVLIIFIGQITTMLLIGLWHDITLNFAAWGLWHGIGLFAHNRWADFTKTRGIGANWSDRRKRVAVALGTFITFNYVALGWVWFALPSIDLSLRFFGKLMGLA